MCRYLVEVAGANTKRRGFKSQTLSHYVASSGSLEKTQFFIDVVGLNVTDRDEDSNKPIDVAANDVVAEFLKQAKLSSGKGKANTTWTK